MSKQIEVSVLLGLLGIVSTLIFLVPISVSAQTNSSGAMNKTAANPGEGTPRPEPAIKLDTTYKKGIFIIVIRPPPLPIPPEDCKACTSKFLRPDDKGLATITTDPGSLLILTQIPAGDVLNTLLTKQLIQKGSMNLAMNNTNMNVTK